MIFQKAVEWYGRCTNIFFLSKLLARVSRATLLLLILFVIAFLIFTLFPHLTCFNCQNTPEGCSSKYQKALSENNILLCEKITTLKPHWEYDNYCREQCKVELGVRNNNPEQCEDIQRLRAGVELYPSLRDACFTAVAHALKDISLCKRAENPEAQQECAKLK